MTITFGTKVKSIEKVYEDHFGQSFKSEDELKKKIKKVWSECAQDLPEICEALNLKKKSVEEKSGGCIKMICG